MGSFVAVEFIEKMKINEGIYQWFFSVNGSSTSKFNEIFQVILKKHKKTGLVMYETVIKSQLQWREVVNAPNAIPSIS